MSDQIVPHKCSRCDEKSVVVFKTVHLCVLHYRIRQMRYDAQQSGKVVPTESQLADLFSDVIDRGMVCGVCNRKMNWLAKDGRARTVSLQHDRDGGFRMICVGCNSRHQHVPGDAFYDVPKDSKWCSSCQQTKPLSEFYCHPSNPIGTRSWCRRCEIEAVVAYKKMKNNRAREAYEAV